MGYVDPFKGLSPSLMACLENIACNTYAVNRSISKIISYIPSVDSYMWHSHVTIFVAINSGKLKYI